MLETRTGNTLSSKSSEAANLYQEAVDLILGSETGAAETLDKALELDKNFALAAAARYWLDRRGWCHSGQSTSVYRNYAY